MRNQKCFNYLWDDFVGELYDLSFSKILRVSKEQLSEQLLDCDELSKTEEHIGETVGANFSDIVIFHSSDPGVD